MNFAVENEIGHLRSLFWSARDPEGRAFAPLADAYRRAGDYKKALELLNEGLSRLPGFAPGHVVAARLYLEKGLLEEAELASRQALDLDDENTVALEALAGSLQALGRLREATEVRERLELLEGTGDIGETPSGEGGLLETAMDVVGAEVSSYAEDTVVDIATLAPDELPTELVMDVAALAPEGAEVEEVMDVGALAPEGVEAGVVLDVESLAPEDATTFVDLSALEEALTEAVLDLEALAPEDVAAEVVLEAEALAPEEAAVDADMVAPEEAVTEPVLEAETLAPEEAPYEAEAEPVPEAKPVPEAEPLLEAETLAPEEAPYEAEAEPVSEAEALAPEEAPYEAEAEPALEAETLAPEEAPYEAEVEPVSEAEALAPEEAPADLPSDDIPDEPLVTRTMAELYAQQGLVDRALEIFSELLRAAPDDRELQERVGQLEATSSPSRGPTSEPQPVSEEVEPEDHEWQAVPSDDATGVDTPFAWTEEEIEGAHEGPGISAYFGRILSWRSDRVADASGGEEE